jgi:hypothetical protein
MTPFLKAVAVVCAVWLVVAVGVLLYVRFAAQIALLGVWGEKNFVYIMAVLASVFAVQVFYMKFKSEDRD